MILYENCVHESQGRCTQIGKVSLYGQSIEKKKRANHLVYLRLLFMDKKYQHNVNQSDVRFIEYVLLIDNFEQVNVCVFLQGYLSYRAVENG